ncbi:MAG: RHS repeat-associated core domain-containing protein, partial [Thermoleophilia bacterium]
AYNGLDKLTQVTTPTSSVNYYYDALGRRISRAEGTNTASYHHGAKGDLADYETNGAGSLSAAYQRGADGLTSRTDYSGTPTTSYYLYNPHGDTSALTDQSGAVTGTYRYDSFGNPIGANTLTDGYTGKWQREKDSSTGIIRMGVREYDPASGRLTSADQLQGTPTDPQQRNRYSYVGNDPLTRYDLSGMYWGESYVNAAEGALSAVRDFVEQPQYAVFTGHTPRRGPLYDSGVADIINDPSLNLGLAIGIGIPGGEFGELGEGTAMCTYEDVTVGRSVSNVATNVTRAEFERNLFDSGWTRSVSSDGKAVNYTLGGAKYSVRDVASTWAGSTADYYPPGSYDTTLEIRMGR